MRTTPHEDDVRRIREDIKGDLSAANHDLAIVRAAGLPGETARLAALSELKGAALLLVQHILDGMTPSNCNAAVNSARAVRAVAMERKAGR